MNICVSFKFSNGPEYREHIFGWPFNGARSVFFFFCFFSLFVCASSSGKQIGCINQVQIIFRESETEQWFVCMLNDRINGLLLLLILIYLHTRIPHKMFPCPAVFPPSLLPLPPPPPSTPSSLIHRSLHWSHTYIIHIAYTTNTVHAIKLWHACASVTVWRLFCYGCSLKMARLNKVASWRKIISGSSGWDCTPNYYYISNNFWRQRHQ